MAILKHKYTPSCSFFDGLLVGWVVGRVACSVHIVLFFQTILPFKMGIIGPYIASFMLMSLAVNMLLMIGLFSRIF